MKAIVTGANGFVGSAIVKELVASGFKVLAIDVTSPKEKLNNVKYLNLSIEHIKNLKEHVKPKEYKYFYHLAWVGSAGPNRNDEKIQLLNALWTADCIRVAKEIGSERFVAAGTIMEFETFAATYAQGNKMGLPYIYGAGKSVAHMISKPLAHALDIDLVWCYITNAYGVGELSPRLINTTIRKIFRKEPLQFSAGTQNYDFIYIDDVAKAFKFIGIHGKKDRGYIIGSSNAQPLKNFLLELVKTVDSSAKTDFGSLPFSGIDLPIQTFDTSVTEEDTGFRASVSFKEGIARTAKWIKEEEFNDSEV